MHCPVAQHTGPKVSHPTRPKSRSPLLASEGTQDAPMRPDHALSQRSARPENWQSDWHYAWEQTSNEAVCVFWKVKSPIVVVGCATSTASPSGPEFVAGQILRQVKRLEKNGLPFTDQRIASGPMVPAKPNPPNADRRAAAENKFSSALDLILCGGIQLEHRDHPLEF